MKKLLKKFLLIYMIVFLALHIFTPIITYATEMNSEETTEEIREEVLDEIINEQKSTLNISTFIREADEYTKNTFPDIDTSEILASAITGKVDNQGIFNKILNLLGEEIFLTIKLLAMILAVIVIVSIVKTIAENLENNSAAKVAYFVQYILIVTIILSNFSEILSLITTTIDSLIGFLYTLVPLLITLMISTGSIVSAGLIQPIILFFIAFIGNLISIVIIPLILVGTVLSIVSNISDKIEIGKISKFFKSSVVWILGIVLTVFVGVLSLEGTLSSSIDGITAKTAKAAVSSLVPVVRQSLRRFNRYSFRKCSCFKKCSRYSWNFGNCKYSHSTTYKTKFNNDYI